MNSRRSLAIAFIATALLASAGFAQEINVLALGTGAMPVVEPPSYSGWPVANMLDDAPSSGWACAGARIHGNVFVFELPAQATISAFEFDTAGIDCDGCGARDLTVEVSPASQATGFAPVLKASLDDRRDGQRFPAQRKIEGRFIRLTIATNHGDQEWNELMSFRGFGTLRPQPSVDAISGTYHTDYNDFHLRQQGTALTGCYEYNEGLFDGTVEGRVMKLTWTEGSSTGPAVFVFSPDGASFRGYWWHGTDKGRRPDGNWDGTRASSTIGTCPHWSGSVSGELHKDLAASGRARLHGILFDTDSARIRPESLPTLDEVVRMMATEPGWKIIVEGHTDATGTPAHNQILSGQRAQSVRDVLVGKGIAPARLSTIGFGQSKPVADNATELGRAQNRRVELVRN